LLLQFFLEDIVMAGFIDYILFISGVAYKILDIFPDIIKWILIIMMFIPFYFWIGYLIFDGIDALGDDTLFAIFWTYMVIGTWVEYFESEVEVSISEWIVNVPDGVYNYIVNNPVIPGIILLIIFMIVAPYLGFRGNTSSGGGSIEFFEKSDSEYKEPDNYARGFSPSEERALDVAEHIKKVRRNL